MGVLAPTVLAVLALVRCAPLSSLVPELVVVSLAKPDVFMGPGYPV